MRFRAVVQIPGLRAGGRRAEVAPRYGVYDAGSIEKTICAIFLLSGVSLYHPQPPLSGPQGAG